jgi:hypothetical protein
LKREKLCLTPTDIAAECVEITKRLEGLLEEREDHREEVRRRKCALVRSLPEWQGRKRYRKKDPRRRRFVDRLYERAEKFCKDWPEYVEGGRDDRETQRLERRLEELQKLCRHPGPAVKMRGNKFCAACRKYLE